MKTVLVVFFLSVQSSYSGNTEIAATEDAFDTVQFYAANGTSWRIKTRSEEHTSELQSLMRISYAVFCLKKKNKRYKNKENNIDRTQTNYHTNHEMRHIH